MWSMSSKVDIFKQDIQIIEMFVPLKLGVSHRTKRLFILVISSHVEQERLCLYRTKRIFNNWSTNVLENSIWRRRLQCTKLKSISCEVTPVENVATTSVRAIRQ